jgi:prepilin-type N-terminal cleavage/methylation domain-containing protein
MNHRKCDCHGDSRGFTLLETMLALAVFSIIGVAVYQVMLRTNQSERVSTTVAEAQQNARIALDTILSDLRQAGYGVNTASTVPVEIASEYRVTFVIDRDADGTVDAGERITYFVDDNAADPIVAASPNPDDYVLRRVISTDLDSLATPASGKGDVIAYGVTQRTPEHSGWNVRLFDYLADDGASLVSTANDPAGVEYGKTVPDTALGKPAGSSLPIEYNALRVSVVTEASAQDPSSGSYRQVRVTGTIHPRNLGLGGAFMTGVAIPPTETIPDEGDSTADSTAVDTTATPEPPMPPAEPPIRIPTEKVLSLELADLNELDSVEGSNVTTDGQHDRDITVGTQVSGVNNLRVWFEGYPDKYPSDRYYNSTSNYAGSSSRTINALESANFDGGDPLARDIVAAVSVSDVSGGFEVWLNQQAVHPGWVGSGAVTTTPNAYYSLGSGSGRAIGIGDFNRDGYQDIALGTVTGTTSGKIEIWYNNGSGAFTRQVVYSAEGAVNALAVADFNHDTWVDIAIGTKTSTNDKGGEVEVWINSTHDTFTRKGPWSSGGKVNAIAAGAMNSDGYIDLVTGTKTGTSTGQVEVWLNDGLGGMALSDAAVADKIVLCVAVGPIDYGNTTNDIVAGTTSRRVQSWFCDSEAASPSEIIPVGESWSDANAGGTVTAVAIGKVEAPWTAPYSDLLNDVVCGTAITSTTGEIVIYLNPYVWTLSP